MKKLLCLSLILVFVLSLVSCTPADKVGETVTREIDRTELLSILNAAYEKTAEQSNITYGLDYDDGVGNRKYGLYDDGKYLYAEESYGTVWLLKENDTCLRFIEYQGEKRKTSSSGENFEDLVTGMRNYMFNSELTDAREMVEYTDNLTCIVSTIGDMSKYSITCSIDEKNYEMEIIITSGLVERIEMFDVIVSFTYSSPALPNFDDYPDALKQ